MTSLGYEKIDTSRTETKIQVSYTPKLCETSCRLLQHDILCSIA